MSSSIEKLGLSRHFLLAIGKECLLLSRLSLTTSKLPVLFDTRTIYPLLGTAFLTTMSHLTSYHILFISSISEAIGLNFYSTLIFNFPAKESTHYHTMPRFDALKIYSCGRNCEKRRFACNKQFLLF